MPRFILPIFLGVLSGCTSLATFGQPRTSMKLHYDNEAMQAEVLKYLSPGMPIENAKRIMQDSGFKCEDSFFEGPPTVRCSAVHGTHSFIIADEIHVLLQHESGKLANIKVDCYSVGP